MNFDLTILNGLLILFLGFCTGVLSTFFGVGGGFIMTPSLNILGLPMSNAVATGLSYTLITSSLGGIKHFIVNNMVIKVGVIVSTIGLIGVRVSQHLVFFLDQLNAADFYIRIIYILLLLSLGIFPLIKKDKQDNKATKLLEKIKSLPPTVNLTDDNCISIWLLIAIGLFIGFLQGFLGVGGGFVLVPIYILLLKIDTHKAVGTSLLTILISSTFGTYYYIISGRINFLIIIILGIGTIFGINFGMKSIEKISSKKYGNFYSIFLLFSSFGIILKQFGLEKTSLVYTLTYVFLITLYILLKYYFEIELPQFKIGTQYTKKKAKNKHVSQNH